MAPKSKQVKPTHAGVKKKPGAPPHQLNSYEKRQDQDDHTSTTATSRVKLPDAESMLISSELKAMAALAATSGDNDNTGSNPEPSNPATYLDILPTEILIRILDTMPGEDQIRLVLTIPELLLNNDRLNIFALDAYQQLAIRTQALWSLSQENWTERLTQFSFTRGSTEPLEANVRFPNYQVLRQPLLHDAIVSGFPVDQIEILLNQYERVCIDQQIDPQAFLHSEFPDRRPAGIERSNHPYRLELIPPLHAAVEAGRPDVARYLIQRGANAVQRYIEPYGGEPVTPFEYGIWVHFVYPELRQTDPARLQRVQDLTIEFAYTFPHAAFDELQRASASINSAIFLGMDNLACLFLERSETQNLDRTTDAYHIARNGLLVSTLSNRYPMPRTILFLLNHGGGQQSDRRIRARAGGFEIGPRTTEGSVAEVAIQDGILENAVLALRWELETRGGAYELAIRAIARYIEAGDEHLDVVQTFANVFIDLDHRGQSQLLGFAMRHWRTSPRILQSLLQSVRPRAIATIHLRLAIYHRDPRATSFILQHLLNRGVSIDERLPRHIGFGNRTGGNWFDTPLTYALARGNYFMAATLLTHGADPGRVPPNIRHRVRVARDRLNTGVIRDYVAFAFRGLELDDNSRVELRQPAEWALNLVFSRFLDDPRFPMPDYVRRRRRHRGLQPDHPDNDSDDEEAANEMAIVAVALMHVDF